jgi:CubicO group peptidase (beta-lactamase class C family)
VFLLAALGAILLPPGVAAQAWNTVEGLDRYISAAQEAWGVPGMAVAVIRDGDVVLAGGYGRRSLDEPGEVDEHTLFAIASNSKAFTSASLATLVEEGRLGWDDRVQDHLPWFQVYSAEEVIRRVRHLPPSGSFRASYGYSNLMFITAGLVIEAVTGQAWANVIQDRFLEPLGMDRTVTSVADLGGMANVASPHSDRGGSLRTFAWYGWDNMAAAGGIISSVSDMSRWMRMQLAEGEFEGRRYFSPQAAHVMWTPHNSFAVVTSARERYPSTHFRGYGLGWSLMDYRGHLVASHGGGYDGMFSRVVLVPEADLGVVVLTNSMTGISTPLTYRVLDAFLGGDEVDWSGDALRRSANNPGPEAATWSRWESERISGTPQPQPLSQFAGTFGGPLYGDATVQVEAGGLVLGLLPNPDLVGDLTHWHHDTFRVRWRTDFSWFGDGLVRFVRGPSGAIEEMKIDVPNGDFWFHELELKRRDP